jgi:hypothetical protein
METGLTVTKVIDIVEYLVNAAITLMEIGAIGMIIYSGFKMATSRGDAKEFGNAKNMLLYAVIGLAVIFGVGIIVRTIAAFGQNPTSIL